MMDGTRKRNPAFIPALVFLLLMVLIIIFADKICIHDPTEIDLSMKFAPNSFEYPFGADDFGRCIFCRCIYAVRNSVLIAFTIEFASVFIGMFVGMLAAYFGGVLDQLFAGICNALMAFPSTILIMLIAAFLGASTRNIILAMLLVNWIWYARISRSITLTTKERKYVQAARLSGARPLTIIRRHIAPSIITQLVGQFTLSLGNVVLGLAGFSFLGIGIQRPTPELGIMISDGCNLIRTNFGVLLWPGVILFLIVLDFNILGEYVSQRLRNKNTRRGVDAGPV